MKGKRHIYLKTKGMENNLEYEIEIKRKITVIAGDSATGKSTFVDLINNCNKNKELNIELKSTNKVITINPFLEETFSTLKEYIILCDEEDINYSESFIDFVNNSDNYFVFFVRESLEAFTYSVDEIYESQSIQEGNTTKNIIDKVFNDESLEDFRLKEYCIITEDSKSGNKFFSALFGKDCIGLGGKRNLKLIDTINNKILLIVDGSAFGSEINKLKNMIHKDILLLREESFEFILLASDLFDKLKEYELEIFKTENYADISEFLTWERFYTELITFISSRKGRDKFYKKSKLNDWYIQKEQLDKVKNYLECKYNIKIDNINDSNFSDISLNW